MHGVGAREGFDPQTQSEAYERLRRRGACRPVDAGGRSCPTSPGCASTSRYYAEHRHEVEHEIDGVVVKVDQVAMQRRLGSTEPSAALGDRVQVPAGGGDDQAARHPGQRRAHRPGHARMRCWSRSSSAA